MEADYAELTLVSVTKDGRVCRVSQQVAPSEIRHYNFSLLDKIYEELSAQLSAFKDENDC